MNRPLLRKIGLITLIFAATLIVGTIFGPASMIAFLILAKIVAVLVESIFSGYRQTMAEKRKREFYAADGARLEVIEDEQATYWEARDAQKQARS
jgi:hypothetical protein